MTQRSPFQEGEGLMPWDSHLQYQHQKDQVEDGFLQDHLLSPQGWESIVQSLKGAAADMAWYMGPTASVREILQKLMVIFRMVASFDVLMQNFYKVT